MRLFWILWASLLFVPPSAWAECPDLLHPWECEPQYRTPAGREVLERMRRDNPYLFEPWRPEPGFKITVTLKGNLPSLHRSDYVYDGTEISGTLGSQEQYDSRESFKYRLRSRKFVPELSTLQLRMKGVDFGRSLRDLTRAQELAKNGFNPKTLANSGSSLPELKLGRLSDSSRAATGAKNCAVCAANSRTGMGAVFSRPPVLLLEFPDHLWTPRPPATPQP